MLGRESDKAELDVTGPSLLEIQPKEIVTIALRVTNLTSQRREFTEAVDLPEGWKLIIPATSFSLREGESEVRLISFLVPLRTPSGKYTVAYTVKDIHNSLVSGQTRVEIIVLPVFGLRVITQEVPVYVVAGESYNVSFCVNNRGNVESEITLEVDSAKDFPVHLEEKKIHLEAGESKIIKVTVETNEKQTRPESHILKLKARAQDAAGREVEAIGVSSVEIIPRVSRVVDRYHRLPAVVGIEWYRKGEDLGFRTGLMGSGSLDEEGTQKIDFFLRGPAALVEGLSDEPQEYRLSLTAEGTIIRLGDWSFALSPLTEQGLYARGAEVSSQREDFRMGVYYLETHDKKTEEWAAHLTQPVRDSWKLRMNSMVKKAPVESGFREDRILSLETEGWPKDNMAVELEYALGQRIDEKGEVYGEAWRGLLSGKVLGIDYSLYMLYAAPDYPGASQDIHSRSLALGIPVGSKLRLWGEYTTKRENLSLNCALLEAPWQRRMEGGLVYRFEGGSALSLSYTDFAKQDRLFPSSFDYGEELVRLGLRHNFSLSSSLRKASLQGYYEWGAKHDNLIPKTQTVNNAGVSMAYRCGDSQYEAYCYTGFDRFTGPETDPKTTAGLDAWYRLSSNTSFNLGIQRSWPEEGNPRDYLSLGLRYRPPGGGVFEAKVRSSWQDGVPEKDSPEFMVNYSIPFSIPISRKKNIGLLKGRIYDAESPNAAGIKDVIIRIDSLTAVTDEEGRFVFPALNPGKYYLDIDRKSIGENRIPILQTPIEITIEGGKEKELNVGVIRSASVVGRLVRFGPQEEGLLREKGAALVEREGLTNVVVQIQSNSESRKCVTGSGGDFIFEQLRPGKWTLKINDEDVPAYHYLEENNLPLDLKPGETRKVFIRVLPRERPIRVIEEKEIILEF